MALVTYQSLCIDVVDPGRMAPFWGETLGLRAQTREDGLTLLVGDTPQQTVWLNRVGEPVTVKQRVHVDVHTAATADVLARGATPVDLESFGWDVLRDPEGGELCSFEREVVPAYRLYELGVDCADPGAVAGWWGEVFGVEAGHDREQGWSWVEGVPGMPFESIVFVPVPEPKTVKNRIHWDVDLTAADGVRRLVDAGARVLREPDDEVSWTVLADPEGNEFCAFAPE